MIQGQINILKDAEQFIYPVEYSRDGSQSGISYSYQLSDRVLTLADGTRDNYIINPNTWDLADSSSWSQQYLPVATSNATINIYIPRRCVDLYDATRYMIGVYIYIHGVKVVLGCHLFSRTDGLAGDRPVRYKGDTYYEMVSIPVPDPWRVLYGNEWAGVRHRICGADINVNNDVPLLTISVNPVIPSGDTTSFVETPGYEGGYVSTFLSSDRNDYINNQLTAVTDEFNTAPVFTTRVRFNKSYEEAAVGEEHYSPNPFGRYLQDTYHLDPTGLTTRYELVMKGPEDIYKYYSFDDTILSCQHNFTKADLGLTSWDEYVEGCWWVSSVNILNGNEVVMTFLSNEVPSTPENFKYFITTFIDNVNPNSITMQNYQVDVVNKVVKTIVSVNKPDDYKANITKPVFIRTSNLSSTIFHPAVTESVCLALNGYKSKVDVFYLRLEGTDFIEVGRTSAGVVFTVVGNNLANLATSGVFYILNESKELVTTGKYTYEQ